MSRERKAIEYAEKELGVHEVYAAAEDVHAKLQASLNEVSQHAQQVRRLHEDIEQREIEIIIELRATNPESSGAAIERMARERNASDQRLRELRETLRTEQHAQDLCEASISASKYRLRILSARMNELGGLAAFYASAKEVIRAITSEDT